MDIKICGLRRPADAEYISEFEEIKYAGFVFFERSKRKVTVDEVLEIKKKLRPDIKTVGVFAEYDISDITDIIERAGFDICQLHSDETNEDCGRIQIPVWKSISMKDASSLEKAKRYTNVQGFVLDSDSGSKRGGIGKTFDWDIAKSFSQKYFTVLAGGINAKNIMAAYDTVRPNVVDMSSSVETDGFKDHEKIKELIYTIRKEDEYGIK